ncbi:MAG: GntR family transcriptional regulator [Opitutaceae bacterium]
MRLQPGVLDLPKRVSLSAQTAAAIRKGAEKGVWQDTLPSERRLCNLFQVSRPTVRSALQQLAKEGLVLIRQGKRNRLVAGPAKPVAAPTSRLVVLVAHRPLAQMTLTAYQGVSEMRAHLTKHGFSTEELVCPAQSPAAQRRKLEAYVRQNQAFCFVLISLSKDLQLWFASRSIPTLLIGSCHPVVRLPSIDVDFHSVCRHAVGVLRGKGHRRMALLMPNFNVAGDLASEAGFIEGAAPRGSDVGAEALVVRHNGTQAGIAAKLDLLFRSAHPPTALLVARPQFLFFVVVDLLKRGIQVPDAVSIISRDHDHLFGDAVSHYRFEDETFAHRLTRLMLQMVDQGYLPAEPNLIFPRYVSGGTVRRMVPG